MDVRDIGFWACIEMYFSHAMAWLSTIKCKSLFQLLTSVDIKKPMASEYCYSKYCYASNQLWNKNDAHRELWLSISDGGCNPSLSDKTLTMNFILLTSLQLSLNNVDVQPSEAGEVFAELLHSHFNLYYVLGTGNKLSFGHKASTGKEVLFSLQEGLLEKRKCQGDNFWSIHQASLMYMYVHKKSCLIIISPAFHWSSRKGLLLNLWAFSKSLCSAKTNLTTPTFNLSECQAHFSSIFSADCCNYENLPSCHGWVIFIIWLFVFTTVCIKANQMKCSSNYAPACDIITYHHLRTLTIRITSMQSCSARYCCHPSNLPLVGALWKIFWSSRKGPQAYQATSVKLLFMRSLSYDCGTLYHT